MFRIPILFVLAGITGLMLYKNEKQRVPVANNSESSEEPLVLGNEQVPQQYEFDSDDDFSDSEASINELDLP